MSEQNLRELLGVQIRFLRRNMDISQAELAKRCKVSQSTIAAVERGRKFPGLHVLYAIENIVGTVWPGPT